MSNQDKHQSDSDGPQEIEYKSGSGETYLPKSREYREDDAVSNSFGDPAEIRLPRDLKLVRKLGQGGMGAVYLVERDSGFNREQLALKTLLAEQIGNPSAIERFKKEIATLLRLRHDHIVALRDFRLFEAYYFFLMEYIEGVTLQEEVGERGPMGLDRLFNVFGPLAQAIDYAHSKGVIHRDLKPMNIMLGPQDTGHLLDFGIARNEERDKTHTRRMGPGTWEYMAPEQFDDEISTTAVDVYGFGATMYFALTARHPFDASGIRKLLAQKDQGCPSMEGMKVPESVRSALGGALSADPDQRPHSCTELIGLMRGSKPSVSRDAGRGNSLDQKEVQAHVVEPRVVEPKEVPESRKAQASLPSEFANSLGIKFRLIPAGKFLMGSPENEKGRNSNELQHEVILTKPYYVGVYPVTRGEFQTFADQSGYRTEGESDGKGAYRWTGSTWEQNSKITWRTPGFEQSDDDPVVCVSWNDAQAYCKWLCDQLPGKYRLPTESEWEYVCRAGSTSAYCFGAEESRLGDYAWYVSNSGSKTHPVGEKRPNAWGLHDMHGNVWEWCSDWYGDSPGVTVTDPVGPKDGSFRVYRGGGWIIGAAFCRSSYRDGDGPSDRYDVLGFRLALSS
jgi:formylglycine-generating enzyme required for sulfatase activity/tRNA A-37 threonylcarbamoyl transferase component Bud32